LKAVDTEQQRKANTIDVLLFRSWCDLAANKEEEAEKQIPLLTHEF
jgi:hypothetical protein